MPKILYIGFGITPATRGGAIVYQESLGREMSRRGFGVAFFLGLKSSGYGLTGRAYIKKRSEGGIPRFELYDSPNEAGYFSDPDGQCRCRDIDALTRRVLGRVKPDIVHIHELQHHSASVVDVIKKSRIPVIKTMHNYYDICPQRDLLFCGKTICRDYNEGLMCAECMRLMPVRQKSPLMHRLAHHLMPGGVYRRLQRFYAPLPLHAGNSVIARAEGPKQSLPACVSQYAARRKYFVDMLNNCDVVHCSSRRSAEIFEAAGVGKNRVAVIAHSNENMRRIERKKIRGNGYPVVFGYGGGRYFHKGYTVLLDAFSRLDRRRAKLVIYGEGSMPLPENAENIEFRTRYEDDGINGAFADIDVGVMPSVWEEMFGILGVEWLAAGIPVIGSDIGGIPDWLKDGENGYLFPPGDAARLAEKLKYFIDHPEHIAELQKKIAAVPAFSAHVDYIERIYNKLLAPKGRCGDCKK